MTSDWRVGLRVTPKYNAHKFFRICGIITNIHFDLCNITLDDGLVLYNEYIDDWVTAEQRQDMF